MFSYFVVAIGGALGSVGRFWLSGAIAQKFGETFPAGTLLVNISGSFIIGFFAALTGPDGRIWSSPSFRQFFMIGVLGGATVLRGPMGFGKSSRMHTAKILRLSMDLPIVIEIVDSEEKINAFLPALEEMMSGGMVTLERVQVIEYRHAERKE